jgi:quercetin dioxygenase-like cupin family protein
MQKLSLDALARELVGQAAGGEKPGDSRVSRTVVGGHEKALRQTVIALAKDAALAEHASPGEATVLVLRGRVTLTAGTESWEGREGDLIIVPDDPHSLTAQADSAVLLTVVKRPLPATAGRTAVAVAAASSDVSQLTELPVCQQGQVRAADQGHGWEDHEGLWGHEGLIALSRHKAFTTPKPFTKAALPGRMRRISGSSHSSLIPAAP